MKMECGPCKPKCHTKCIGEMKFKIYEECCRIVVAVCPHCGHEYEYHKHHCCPRCGMPHQKMFDPPEMLEEEM